MRWDAITRPRASCSLRTTTALAHEKGGSLSAQRTLTVPRLRAAASRMVAVGARVSPLVRALTNALRQTLLELHPGRVVRSVHATPSALTYDWPGAARGATSAEGCSSGIGCDDPGVVSSTATTKSRPSFTATGVSSFTVW